MIPPSEPPRALCADPAVLPLVDAAMDRGKASNEAAREMARLCRRCPCAADCVRQVVARPAEGVWGGVRWSGRNLTGAGKRGRLKVVT